MSDDLFDQEMDDLLADIHMIIDDESPAKHPKYDPELDLGDYYDEPEPEPQKPAQQPSYWTQTQKLPKHVAKLQKNQTQAYADWLYEQGSNPPVAPPPLEKKSKKTRSVTVEEVFAEQPPAPKKKKGHGFRNFVIVLLILALLLLAAVVFLLPQQPTGGSGPSARKDGVSTILLAGMDQSGMRTDTLMLLTVDRPGRSLSLVSIPRDTLVLGSYTVPKINSVYGVNNGGAEGIEMLLTRVAQSIGYTPDGYMLIRLDAFVELVDALGGVEFDVPVDMFYNDPAQDLYIDLLAGPQTLTGEEAMGVVRFRSGYADADLGRIQVQRQFLSALLDQAVSLEGAAKSPLLLQILLDHTESDLDARSLLWLAESVLLSDLGNIQTATLPGSARSFPSGSYYVLDPESVAQTVNTYCNPYEAEITTEHLEIRQG